MVECFHRVADILCSEKKEHFELISLSGQTIARRTEELKSTAFIARLHRKELKYTLLYILFIDNLMKARILMTLLSWPFLCVKLKVSVLLKN